MLPEQFTNRMKEMLKEEGIKVLSALEPIAEDERARRKV